VIVVELHMDMALKVSDSTKPNCAIVLLKKDVKPDLVMVTMSPPVMLPEVGI
jgi:hypothetical protein